MHERRQERKQGRKNRGDKTGQDRKEGCRKRRGSKEMRGEDRKTKKRGEGSRQV